MRNLSLSSLLVFSLFTLGAQAADPATGPSQADRDFMEKAARGGQLEVRAGKLAAEHAQDPAIRSFGEKMVSDHTAANAQLKSLANTLQAPLPEDLGPDGDKKLGKLEGLIGAEFDRTYTHMMVSDHEEDIRDFQKEAKRGHDPGVKEFAAQTLPTLRHHLMLANQLSKAHDPK
jgi:putative membrane protein